MGIYTNGNGIGWHDFQWNMELHQYGTWNELEHNRWKTKEAIQNLKHKTTINLYSEQKRESN